MGPRSCRLESCGRAEHHNFLAAPPDDLKPHRQPGLGEPARDGDGGQPQQREGVGEVGALHGLAQGLAANLDGVRQLDGEGRRGGGRREPEIVGVEEGAHTMPELSAQELTAGDVAGREREALHGVLHEA